jgi:hypothetical protein
MPFGATVPVCKVEPLPGRSFCADHQAQLDRVRAGAQEPSRAVVRSPAQQRLPKAQRALMLARAVHAAGHLTADQAAAAAGVERRGLAAITAYAREQGWIVGVRGGAHATGGYKAGEVTPTRDVQEAAA